MERGTLVLLNGLRESSLNLQRGVICEEWRGSRYAVKLKDRTVRVRPNNIRPLQAQQFFSLQKRVWEELRSRSKMREMDTNGPVSDIREVAAVTGMKVHATPKKVTVCTSDGQMAFELETTIKRPCRNTTMLVVDKADVEIKGAPPDVFVVWDADGMPVYFQNLVVLYHLSIPEMDAILDDPIVANSVACNMVDMMHLMTLTTKHAGDEDKRILYRVEEGFAILMHDDVAKIKAISIFWHQSSFFLARASSASVHKLMLLSTLEEDIAATSGMRGSPPMLVPGCVLTGGEAVVRNTASRLLLSDGRLIAREGDVDVRMDAISFLFVQILHLTHFVERIDETVYVESMQHIRQIVMHLFWWITPKEELCGSLLRTVLESNLPGVSHSYAATQAPFDACLRSRRKMFTMAALADAVVRMAEIWESGVELIFDAETNMLRGKTGEKTEHYLPSIAADPEAAALAMLRNEMAFARTRLGREYKQAVDAGFDVDDVENSSKSSTTSNDAPETMDTSFSEPTTDTKTKRRKPFCHKKDAGTQTSSIKNVLKDAIRAERRQWNVEREAAEKTRKLELTNLKRELDASFEERARLESAVEKETQARDQQLASVRAEASRDAQKMRSRQLEAERQAECAKQSAKLAVNEASATKERLQAAIVAMEVEAEVALAKLASEEKAHKILAGRMDKLENIVKRAQALALSRFGQQICVYASRSNLCVDENVIDTHFVLTLPAAKNLHDLFMSLAEPSTNVDIFEAVEAQNDRLQRFGEHRMRLIK